MINYSNIQEYIEIRVLLCPSWCWMQIILMHLKDNFEFYQVLKGSQVSWRDLEIVLYVLLKV